MQNPAYINTAGSYLKHNHIEKLALKGPLLVQQSQNDWSSTKDFENVTSNDSHCLTEISGWDIEIEVKINSILKIVFFLKKLTRVKSFVMRFIDNIKLRMKNKDLVGNLMPGELSKMSINENLTKNFFNKQ